MHSFATCRVRTLLCVIITNVLFFNAFSIYQLSLSKTNWTQIYRPFYDFAFSPRSCKVLHLPEKTLIKTAMVAFPGSGSTWLRYLIQQATGLMTGSVQIDPQLKANFPGEGIVNSSMLIVSTCDYRPQQMADWEKAIILVRNPFDSIVRKYYRQFVVTSSIKEGKLRTKFKQGWDVYVKKQPVDWLRLYLKWLEHFQGPLLVVHFEKVKAKPIEEMRRLLKFLEQNVSEEDLNCMLRKSSSYVKLKPSLSNVTSHFSRSLQIEINRYQEILHRVLAEARNKKKLA